MSRIESAVPSPQFNPSYQLSQVLPIKSAGGFASSNDSKTLQLIGKDGKVKGIINETAWADGSKSYHFLSGNGATPLALPVGVKTLAQAKAFAAKQLGIGSWKDPSQPGPVAQKATVRKTTAPATKAPATKTAPVSGWIGEGASTPVKVKVGGQVTTGKITQTSWNTGSGGSTLIFQGAGITKELPANIKTSAAAQTYINSQFASGSWKEAIPFPRLYDIPDNKGRVTVWSNGTTQITDLKAKRAFVNREWQDAGFVVQEARIYTDNKMLGGADQHYDQAAKGYLLSKENPSRNLVMDRNGKPITNLEVAKKRVAELMARGTFTPQTLQVAKMSPKEKLSYAFQHALKNLGPAAAGELKSLFTLDTLAKAALLGGAQFIPGVNFAVNAFVGILVGKEAIELGTQFIGAINASLNAKTKEELESAGQNMAEASARLGVGVGMSLVGAGAAKVAGKIRPGIKTLRNTKPPTTIKPSTIRGQLYGNAPVKPPTRSPIRTPNAAEGTAPRPVGHQVPTVQKSKTPKGQFAPSGVNNAEGAYRNRNPRSETVAKAAAMAPVEPVTKIEQRAVVDMVNKSFPDFAKFMGNMKDMSMTSVENAKQKKARVDAQKQIKSVGENIGHTDITNVKIVRRDAKNVIILSSQQSSTALSPNSAAADITYDAKYMGKPIKVSLTGWYNPGVFARSPNLPPYVEGIGNLNPKVVKLQTTSRLGSFEMGLQTNVGSEHATNASKYLNAGFSMIARGAHGKTVLDFNQKGKFVVTPSINFSVDASAYLSLGLVRLTTYGETGRVVSVGKKFKVYDVVNVGVNPALVNDAINGNLFK